MKITTNFSLSEFARCMAKVPAIYSENEQIITIRNNYEAHLKKVLEAINNENFTVELSFDLINEVLPCHMPYQGLNDSNLYTMYSQIVNKIASTKYPQWSIKKDLPDLKANEKIRIGFVSSFFYDHPIWEIFLKGWIKNLDKNKFELFGYYTNNKNDLETNLARRNFVKFVQSSLEIDEWCQIINDDQLHILIFSGLEMESKILNLGALRLAPIQIAISSRPEILSLSTIDYYLTSNLIELDDEQEDYREKSISLPNLGIYYEPNRIQNQQITKKEIGMQEDDILFCCCQSLSRYLPQHDDIFPCIAKKVKNSKFVFLESSFGNNVTDTFRKRLKAIFSKFELDYQKYCLILPRLYSEGFAGILNITDIFLDTIGWSEYSSTLESINYNIPLITLPNKLLQSRWTIAILKMMDIEETIASSKNEYIKIAVNLAQEYKYRTKISQKIATNKFKLYYDLEPVESLENFLFDLIYETPIYIASYFHNLKNFPKAEQLYKNILKHNPKYEKAAYLLAILKQQTRDYDSAEKLLISSLENNSKSFLKWYSLGNIYQTKKDFPQAIKCYEEASTIQPKEFSIYNNLGYAWQGEGNLVEAIKYYQHALKLNPDSLVADINLANALFEQGNLSENKKDEYALKNYNMGITQEQEGNLEIAQICYQKALLLKSNFVDAQCKLGKLLQAQGNKKQAKACYQKAITIAPNHGKSYYNLGIVYQDEDELENAAIFFKKGLKLINNHYKKSFTDRNKAQSIQLLEPRIIQERIRIGNYLYPKIPSLIAKENYQSKYPFWSVVIPVYKRKKYLLECLASVLNQWESPDNMEIIVVDNGSEPPLQQLVESIGKGIVRYYRHPRTIKLQENWNSAVAFSRGKWVHLLHDDDYVLPQFYSCLKEGLENLPHKVGAAFTSYYNVDEKRQPQWPQLYNFSKGIVSDWSKHIGISCPIIPPSIVIRRSAYEEVGGYNTEHTFTTDWELYMRVASFYDAYYEPQILVNYRRHKETVSSELMHAGAQAKSIRCSIEMSESYLPSKHVKKIITNARKFNFELLFREVKDLAKNNNMNVAIEVLQEALKISSAPESLDKVFSWLNTNQGKHLRQEIVKQLTKTSLKEIEHNFDFVNP